jgi:VCBS repeat-containing protein
VAFARRTKLYFASGLCLAGLLLSGCSTPAEPNEETSGAAWQISADELESQLKEFVKDDPKAKVISDAKLRESIPEAQAWIEGLNVSPSKCGVTFAAPVTEQLAKSKMAAVQFDDRYLTVAVYQDIQALKNQWESEAKASAECARYSVTSDGKTRAYHLAKQSLKTKSELNDAYVVTSSDGSTTQQQLVIRAARGNVMIGFQQETSAKQTQEQLQHGAERIDALFEELK